MLKKTTLSLTTLLLTITLFANSKTTIAPELSQFMEPLSQLVDQKVLPLKREVFSILDFISDAKKSARTYSNDLFLLNDAEIDCKGNVTTADGSEIGLVSFVEQKSGELTVFGFTSVFSKKPVLTVHIKMNDENRVFEIQWFTNHKSITAKLNTQGESFIKVSEKNQVVASVSWDSEGNGKWMKQSKAGKYSGGVLKTEKNQLITMK